jgi:BASS family bile acid:Na+ symporter
MRLVSKPLEWMARRASPLLAVALFIGIALPDLARLFKPLIGPSVVVLLIATLLRIDWPQALAYARRPGRVLVVVAWLALGAPLVMAAAVRLIAPPEMLGHALVLMASSPVLISVPTFALMLGLDAPLALVAMVVTSALQPFVQPPLTLALLGVELNIGVAPLMARLAFLVGGSFVAALLIRGIAGRKRIEQAAAPIGGLAVLMLIVFGIGIMDGVTAMLLDRPGHVLLFLGTAFAGNFALQAIGAVLFWGLCRGGVVDWRQGLTAALASGNRNLAILVAALGPSIHPDLLLYLAMGQFPMFLVPAVLGPVYRMLLRVRNP